MKALTFMKDIKTAKMKDKDKLKKLVEIIGDLIKEKGNEWLIDDILKTIEETSPIEEIAKHSVIQNINEYCIEQKIDKQANEFYNSFPIEEIKPQLIIDYKKMEHERRQDDFENFCLSMYQQFEIITNHLFEKKIKENWESNKNKIAYQFPNGKKLTYNDLIFGNAKDWFANVKFKAVLYFFYFTETLKVIIPFNDRVKVFDELYQMRNQNHRGNRPSSYQQKILDGIKDQEAKYYFKFYGFLQDFVSGIESSYNSSKSVESNKPKKTKKPSNTIGENNPELEKLKNKIENTL